MKNALRISGLFILAFSIYITQSCKKEKPVPPTVTTAAVTTISYTTATSGGEVTNEGGNPVTSRGICWNTSADPTVSNNLTSETGFVGLGSFPSNMSGLTPNTLYYVRAYASNAVGTGYGSPVTFSTIQIAVAALTTTTVINITPTTATTGGNITSENGGPVTARGVCWGTATNPTIANNKTTDASGSGGYNSSLSGLLPGTTYYVRSYATNSAGTSYGNELSFTTLTTAPVLTTSAVTSITLTSATGGGVITSDGGAPVTARGLCWNTSANPTTANNKTTVGTGTGVFPSSIAVLTPGTTYFVRAYATNSVGTSYGNEISFTTLKTIPTLTTTAASSITLITAVSGGNITSDGGAAVTARGICWSTSTAPTIANNKTTDGTGTGIFTSSLTGLTTLTPYYVRAYATNSEGTAYGYEINFFTSSIGTPVSDVDGNTYNTIIIGTQTWMSENLKTTKFNDGTAIPLVIDNTLWTALTTSGYCWYAYNSSYKATYGALYNWYTLNATSNGGKNVCPAGWHVPTEAQWNILTDYLGGLTVAGGKLKEAGTTHWVTSNIGATNESGFSAMPGGWRVAQSSGIDILNQGFYYSATEFDATTVASRYMMRSSVTVEKINVPKFFGLSVRCLKD
jgi:uncharacterized protein (TIGR02145 family)